MSRADSENAVVLGPAVTRYLQYVTVWQVTEGWPENEAENAVSDLG